MLTYSLNGSTTSVTTAEDHQQWDKQAHPQHLDCNCAVTAADEEEHLLTTFVDYYLHSRCCLAFFGNPPTKLIAICTFALVAMCIYYYYFSSSLQWEREVIQHTTLTCAIHNTLNFFPSRIFFIYFTKHTGNYILTGRISEWTTVEVQVVFPIESTLVGGCRCYCWTQTTERQQVSHTPGFSDISTRRGANKIFEWCKRDQTDRSPITGSVVVVGLV